MERAEARGPTNLHFSKSFFFLTKNILNFSERSSLTEITKVFIILALRGWGFGGKCDMLLLNSLLIFISKNLLKVRMAVVISKHFCFVGRGQQFFSKKSYQLFTDSNVTIKNKINVNSGSNEQTTALNCHLPTRVPDYS